METKVYKRQRYVWHACIDCGKERWVRWQKGKLRNLRCHPCALKIVNTNRHLTAEAKKRISVARTTHGGSDTRLFNIWGSMIQRTTNSNDKSYKDYGGRGIFIIPKWRLSFENFRDWSYANGYYEQRKGTPFKDLLSIDRIDNDNGYMPQNCQWLTLSENVRKRNEMGYTRLG